MAFDKFIEISKFFLIIGGDWPFKMTDNRFFAKLYNFFSNFQAISFIALILSLFINLIVLLVEHDDLNRIFSAVNVLIICAESCTKVLLFRLKKIPDMCSYVMQHEEELLTNKTTDREIENCYRNHANYCRKVNLVQFLATLASCFFFALVALLQLFAGENFKDKPFMHDMWFPFRRERHLPTVIFICLFVDTQGVIFNTYTQTTFIGLMIFASARLQILQVKLRKFDQIADNQYNGDVLFAVKRLIVEHRDIIGFVQSLNDRTKYVMLLEYILNSVCLATGLIQLIVADTASVLSLFFIIFLVVIQIFIMAWSANEICVASLGVADAIFASNWTQQNDEVKKLLLIMIMRAQVPVGLTAGPFFQMRTNTALTTVKIAYSYVSFMAQSVR